MLFNFVKIPVANKGYLSTSSTHVLNIAKVEYAIQTALPDTRTVTPTRSTPFNLLGMLKGRYLVNKQLVDFGRVQQLDKTATITVYRNGGIGAGNAVYNGIALPLSADPTTLKLDAYAARSIVLTYSPLGAPAFYLQTKTIGAKFNVKAMAGIFLRGVQAAKIETVYKFKTALQDAIDGTEVRKALLDTPFSFMRYEVIVKTTDLTSVLQYLKTIRNGNLMLPVGDSFTVEILSENTLTASRNLAQGDAITVEKVGKIEDEIIHIGLGTTVHNYTKDTATSNVTIESGKARLLEAFKLKSIDSIDNQGDLCTIGISVYLA